MIVTFQELKNYSGLRKWSPASEDAATMILDGLQAELEAYLRRPIETQEFTERYVIQYPATTEEVQPFYSVYAPTAGIISYTTDGPMSVPFRNSPVLDITSVGTYCSTSGSVTAIERGSGWVQQRYGIDLYSGTPGTVLQVSYTAGLEWDKPEAIRFFKLMILRAAAREVQSLFDQNVGKQEFNGDAQPTFPIGFGADELDKAKRYRRQRI